MHDDEKQQRCCNSQDEGHKEDEGDEMKWDEGEVYMYLYMYY